MSGLRAQYEKFPYPPIPIFALPKRGQGRELSYEEGTRLAFGAPRPHTGIRILVAGAGTLEPLVVAQAHPEAREVVAVDFSARSLARLRFRFRLARVTRFISSWPPIRTVQEDLHEFGHQFGSKQDFGSYDYVLASNVLHHVSDPALLLRHLSRFLKPSGIMRIVTYPYSSRLWMRETSRWLKLNGITPEIPDLLGRARETIENLPPEHPVRSCFESQPETKSRAGLVDAFLNAFENPLTPLQWKTASKMAGLELVGEGQDEASRSSFLDEIAYKARALHPWIKLQVLDDLLELCANPVLWMKRIGEPPVGTGVDFKEPPVRPLEREEADFVRGMSSPEQFIEGKTYLLPSRPRYEMKTALVRADAWLGTVGLRLDELIAKLRTEVGPRVSAGDEHSLPGLAIVDYDLDEIMSVPEPWGAREWEALDSKMPELSMEVGVPPSLVPGGTLREKAEWIQVRFGPGRSMIPVRFRKIMKKASSKN
ncbi:MAG TPA: class I SAM-dependent methyltransferase [Bdellovibrionota bacterium]|nr:class I SAM-dependent methyltransferase [Bdellovibrionota bacterium]